MQANYLALAVATHDRVYEAQALKPSDPQWQELESRTQDLWAKQSSKWQKHHLLKSAEQLDEAIRNKDTAPQDWPKNAVIDKELSAAALELLKGQEPTATRVAFPTGWFVSTSNDADGYPTYRIIQVVVDVQRGEHRKDVWYRLRQDAAGHGSYGHLYVFDGPNGEFFLD